MTSPALVILAAGMGSRYGGIKQIDPVGPSGEIVLDYSVYDAVRAGFEKVVFVIRRDIETPFREHIGARLEQQLDVAYVFQEMDAHLPAGFDVPADRGKPWGTGHAILCCRDAVDGPFCVINADDFYGAEAYRLMATQLQACPEQIAMVGYQLANTLSDHGSVSRGACDVADGCLRTVVERTRIEPDGDGARFLDDNGAWQPLTGNEVVSMNFWGFPAAIFGVLETQFHEFIRARGTESKSEFFIPSVVDRQIREAGERVRVLETDAQWFGVTYPEDKPVVVRKIAALVENGIYPERLWN